MPGLFLTLMFTSTLEPGTALTLSTVTVAAFAALAIIDVGNIVNIISNAKNTDNNFLVFAIVSHPFINII